MKWLRFSSASVVSGFFVALCALCLVSAWQISSRQFERAQRAAEITRFEVNAFEYRKITQNGAELIAKGERAREIVGQKDRFIGENVAIENASNGARERLLASLVTYDGARFYFDSGVDYYRDAAHFWSKQASYDPKMREFIGSGEFRALNEKGQIFGQDVRYENGKIYAKDIKGTLKR